jgi:hypothetical protein
MFQLDQAIIIPGISFTYVVPESMPWTMRSQIIITASRQGTIQNELDQSHDERLEYDGPRTCCQASIRFWNSEFCLASDQTRYQTVFKCKSRDEKVVCNIARTFDRNSFRDQNEQIHRQNLRQTNDLGCPDQTSCLAIPNRWGTANDVGSADGLGEEQDK